MRIANLSVMIPDCPRCGYPIIVNGFSTSITCASCHSDIAIGDKQWGVIFREVYQQTKETLRTSNTRLTMIPSGSFEIHADAAGAKKVPCSRCATPLEIGQISGDTSMLFCHSCGNKHPMMRLPNHASGSKARYVIHPLSKEEDDARLKQMTPITMNCPSCAAALKISTENERITVCSYCNGEFMIPDPLWQRLHPVKKAMPWTVLYDQPPPPTKEERKEKKRRDAEAAKKRKEKHNRKMAAQQIEQQRNRLRKSIEATTRKIQKTQKSFWKGTFGGMGIAAFVGIFVVGFPFIFIPPLSHLIGDQICPGGFEVSTSSSGGTTSYHYYCTSDGFRETFHAFGFLAILLGSAAMVSLWLLYAPIRFLKMRGVVKGLEKERSIDEEALFKMV